MTREVQSEPLDLSEKPQPRGQIRFKDLSIDDFAPDVFPETRLALIEADRLNLLTDLTTNAGACLYLYYLTSLSRGGIGQILNKTGSGVGTTIRGALRNIYKMMPEELQKKFPFDIAMRGKYYVPTSPQLNPQRRIYIDEICEQFSTELDQQDLSWINAAAHVNTIDRELWDYAVGHNLLSQIIETGLIPRSEIEDLKLYWLGQNTDWEPTNKLLDRFSKAVANLC